MERTLPPADRLCLRATFDRVPAEAALWAPPDASLDELRDAVTKGTLGTTFTASQGLLLMLPNMYKEASQSAFGSGIKS